MSVTCPMCKVEVSWQSAHGVSPNIEKDLYRCPNPDCDVVDVDVIHEL